MEAEVFARKTGRAVRERRRALGMTQKELAQMAGVSLRFVVSLEMGEASGARLSTLLRVFDAVGMSLSFAVEGDGGAEGRSKHGSAVSEREKQAERDAERYVRAFEHAVAGLTESTV